MRIDFRLKRLPGLLFSGLAAIGFGLGGQLEQGVEGDDRLGVGCTLADDAGPHGVVELGIGVGHDRPLAERVPGGLVADLDGRGVSVMLSNSNTPLIRKLYSKYKIEEVQARRSINSKASKRGAISELIVRNY